MIITPSDELDAVNQILSAIGSSPVSSLDNDLNVDVLNAKRVLQGVSKQIQSRGWDFNIEDSVYLPPDPTSGLVSCPNNYLKFYGDGYKLIRRQGYFFDIASQSNIFKNGLTISIVRYMDFSELPEAFRKYITAKSCRIFQMRYLSSDTLNQHLMTEQSVAYAEIVNYELVTGKFNIYQDDMTISQNIMRS